MRSHPSRTSVFDRPTTNIAAESAPEGDGGPRGFHGSVDPAPGGRGHCQVLWVPLPPRLCMDDPAWRGIELSETGAASPRAGRGDHEKTAGRAVALNKKTLEDPVGALFFKIFSRRDFLRCHKR